MAGPFGWNEHMPTIAARTMQASTSGASDQNMSRPSWNSLGLGSGWVTALLLLFAALSIVAPLSIVVGATSIPGLDPQAGSGTI